MQYGCSLHRTRVYSCNLITCTKFGLMIFKRILSIVCATLFALITNAQQKMKTYDNEWKQIDSLIQKNGLTESALTEVNKIYTAAKKEGNDAQIIKALLYRMGLQQIK